jgi:3-oxoacyl-[acyl-carrier protein] reductase
MITYNFLEKVVLVTGSSRGMGAAILDAFAKAGATVFAHYFADAQGINRGDADKVVAKALSHGTVVHLLEGDVRSFDSVQKMFAQIQQLAGRLDILVNNAGILRDRTIKKMTLDEWHSVMETNLNGVFYCSKLAAEMLADGGRIINVSSIAGLVGFPGQANYAAAKAGVAGLTRALAQELGSRNITVNCVAPGFIDTDMTRVLADEQKNKLLERVPLGRLGRVTDIAPLAVFLASDESAWITGEVIRAAGGLVVAT